MEGYYSYERVRSDLGISGFHLVAGVTEGPRFATDLFLYFPDPSLCGESGQEKPKNSRVGGIYQQLAQFCRRHQIDLCGLDYAGWGGSTGFDVPIGGVHCYSGWGQQIFTAFNAQKRSRYSRIVVIGHGVGALAAIGLALLFPRVISEVHAINPGISRKHFMIATSRLGEREFFIPLTTDRRKLNSVGALAIDFNNRGSSSLLYGFSAMANQDRISCPVRIVFADMDKDPETGRAQDYQQLLFGESCPADNYIVYKAPCGHTSIKLALAGDFMRDVSRNFGLR